VPDGDEGLSARSHAVNMSARSTMTMDLCITHLLGAFGQSNNNTSTPPVRGAMNTAGRSLDGGIEPRIDPHPAARAPDRVPSCLLIMREDPDRSSVPSYGYA
jgi:hypothetical protein